MILNTKLFTFSKSSKAFLTEMSTLDHLDGMSKSVFMSLQSHKTNEIVSFGYSKTIKDNEGDVQAWEYLSTDKRFPDLKVIIFNT